MWSTLGACSMWMMESTVHLVPSLCFLSQCQTCSRCVLVSCQSLTANKRTNHNWKVMSWFVLFQRFPEYVCWAVSTSGSRAEQTEYVLMKNRIEESSLGRAVWLPEVLYLYLSQQIIRAAASCKGSAWVAYVCQEKAGWPYPWSSPDNILFLLTDMLMWHLQQVAPIRSVPSVTVTPPKVQIPCDSATEPSPKNHHDLFNAPFPFSVDLFPWIFLQIKQIIFLNLKI